MMKTRRAKKSANAAASESGPSSDQPEEPRFTVAIPDDLDLDTLSSIFPNVEFSTPSSEIVAAIYRLLVQQATDLNDTQRELEEARAEAEKKDVELDQALQDRETMSKDLEQSLESCQADLHKVKQERDQLLTSQAALQAQVTTIHATQTTSTAEVDGLKVRVEDVEREKRDLVVVISRLKQEGEEREDEIQTLRLNLKEARQDHQTLESQIRELRSVETSTKFKFDTLNQQFQLVQGEAERTANELNSKTEEFSKYRRTKSAEMTNLQASYDSLKQNFESVQASLKALQSSHTQQSHQLTQALARVQDLTGQLAEQEATYASEANGLRRLVSMMEEREQQAKEIVESIEKEWAGVGEKAEQREATLRDEVDRERRAREEAEKRLYQLETVLDRMGRGELPLPSRSTPTTPLRTPRTADVSTMDVMMGLSPTVAMASKTQKSGKTFTEVYADYVRLQDEYAQKCAEYDHMDRTLTSVLAQIEERAPVLSQQRAEYERLQSEASELAVQLSNAISEREAQTHLAQENGQKLGKSVRENELLQKQLEDLGRQVQSLLREIARRDDPTLVNAEEVDVQPMVAEDTDTLISNNLVLFKSISSLQEQNQKLLRIVRELSSKMENEEREYKDSMEREQSEAIREAHEAMQELAAQLDRQKKNSDNVIQAYVKERDALKAMLARAEKAVGGPLSTDAAGSTTRVEGQSGSLVKELVEVQSQFEAYKTEMGIDSVRLRDDLVASQREVAQLSAALAKANAKIEFLTDRHRMHQEQFSLHAKDIDDLTKRNQKLFDQWTRIDIECSRATEDFQVANGRIEQLRNECANLRAEKKIWESVQGRLVEENKTLALERSHLSDLMANVQKMHNDLERSGENDRRRLESQLQMLEGQGQDLRVQLSQERDTIRHIGLQKDIELKELQNRLDKGIQELSKTRENLVGAETSKKHLEERISDLTKQIYGSEEKLAVYERRPSATSGTSQTAEQGISREQQLESEVAELRSALKVAEFDLAAAKGHVQQFKEISQASEEALSNLNSTYDDYKASTEAQISRHQVESAALQERLEAAQEELAQLRNRHSELQKTFDDEKAAWTNDKRTLEGAIVDLSTSEKHAETDRSSRENEIHLLEDRAKAAEERYSNEVVAHAESIKSVESLKRELLSSQSSSRDSLKAAETAQVKLTTSEGSWKHQKEALDKEVVDLNARIKDLSEQNRLLHQHLDSVSSQATRIRQAADSSASAPAEGDATDNADAKLAELRSVVQYLRKEKEIVELQLELSKQENARLKGQIEHLSHALDETRATLSEERERAVETAASASQHAELVERINQLNILRESNATLRTDCENHAKRARDLETKLQQLSSELEPSKEQVQTAQAELEATKAHMTRLEEENRRWQERNSQLLTKYERIDPAEMKALKDEIESLKAQKAEIEQQKTALEASRNEAETSQAGRIESLEATIRSHRENQLKFSQRIRAQIGELNNEKSRLLDEKRVLEGKVTTLEQQANEAQNRPAETGTSQLSQDQNATIAALQAERDKLLAEKAALEANQATAPAPAPTSNPEEGTRVWEAEKAELIRARDEAFAQVKTATEEAQKAADDIRNIRRQNENFQTRIQSLTKAKSGADSERETAVAAAVAIAVQKAKAEFENGENVEELRSLEEKLRAQHQEELQAAIENARKEQNTTIPPPNQQAAIEAAVVEHQKALEEKHAKDIEGALERGRMEQATKNKLKDAQLVKAQTRVKDLEIRIQKWKDAGYIPPEELAATAPKTLAPVPRPAAPTPAAPSQGPTQATPAPNVPPTGPGPARKPGPTPTGPAAGVGRGGTAIRGQARVTAPRGGAIAGRGGAPVRPVANALAGASANTTTPTAPAATAPPGSLTIVGASKRPREEQANAADDTLAKRIRPAPETQPKPAMAPRRLPPQQTQPGS